MSELRAPREVDMVPEDLRYVPQVKSDIIIQRREVSMAPVEGMSVYRRDATNTITFNVQGHKTTNQLLDAKSCFFTWQCKFRNGYPVEDVSNLIEEIIVSSNGRVLERIRHQQYINYYMRQYCMSRPSKRRLGKREGFNKYEDPTIQYRHQGDIADMAVVNAANGAALNPAAKVALVPGDSGLMRRNDTSTNGLEEGNVADRERLSDNYGYYYSQINRNFTNANVAQGAAAGAMISGFPTKGNAAGADNPEGTMGWKTMKFRLRASGLLSCEKMLPIGWMPLTIQLRLSDKMRCTDKSSDDKTFDYAIKRPRMHFSVCTVGQAYAAAMQQRLRGPGITINAKLFDTHFKIIKGDEQLVIPCNKQRLSKVYLMFHDEDSATNPKKNAFRSSVSGSYITKENLAKSDGTKTGKSCLMSYQFQVGTEVSEPVALEYPSKGLLNYNVRPLGNAENFAEHPNTGMPFLEAYLKSIGAVNGHEQDVEYWGRKTNSICNSWEGGDLLETFLAKYFVAVYDGEKFLGTPVESGVDTEAGKDIVCDLRFAGGSTVDSVRVMALIQYHAQFVIKENSVDLSY